MSPTRKEWLTPLRERLASKSYEDAAIYLCRNMGLGGERKYDSPMAPIREFLNLIFIGGNYEEAAYLLWGDSLFNTNSESVQTIWNALPSETEIMFQGASAMGKTHSIGVWAAIDFLRDPDYTCFKVISVTKEHAKRNVFANIKNLFELSSIPMFDRVPTAHSIQTTDDDKQGIHLVAIPKGDSGRGHLRGFHPVPRIEPHPIFGGLSRIRVILDEAEEIPGGVWEDVDNILSGKDGKEGIKVFSATNPKDRNSHFAQRSEPVKGWGLADIEKDSQWRTKSGALVIRLDGAKCENVVQKKVVYPGLLTWEGYQNYLSHGDTSSTYMTMARGWYPEEGMVTNVIPINFVSRAKGAFNFVGKTIYVGSVDIALLGKDRAVMAIGKYGQVASFNSPNTGEKKFEKIRYGLQLEALFKLPKKETVAMAEQIKQQCKVMNILPGCLAIDRTGMPGVHDVLMNTFGEQVFGINYSSSSTETRVLEDEKEKASELYDGLVTELVFGVRKFLEFDYLKIGLGVDISEFQRQASDRRFKLLKDRVRVESKQEYIARGNSSPDEFDSVCGLVFLVRQRTDFIGSMLALQSGSSMPSNSPGSADLDFLDFGS